MKKFILGLAFALACIYPASASATSLTYYAAGDIACAPGFTKTTVKCHQSDTNSLITTLTATYGNNGVIALGDTQYNAGLFSEFTGTGTYDATWGGISNTLIHPVVGNHEWTDTFVGPNDNITGDPGGATAAGYKHYFTSKGVTWSAGTSTNCPNDANGQPCAYYSWNQGQWHFISLDSECPRLVPPNSNGGCSVTGKEYKWLVDDLDHNTQPCILAAWHRPRFSSGANGSSTSMSDIWNLLYGGTPTQNGGTPQFGTWTADIVLNGHDHDFERFARLDGTGAVAPLGHGIREYVVGTGGEDHSTFGTPLTGSEERDAVDFGVLKLTLNTAAYFAQFYKEDGTTFGTVANNTCH